MMTFAECSGSMRDRIPRQPFAGAHCADSPRGSAHSHWRACPTWSCRQGREYHREYCATFSSGRIFFKNRRAESMEPVIDPVDERLDDEVIKDAFDNIRGYRTEIADGERNFPQARHRQKSPTSRRPFSSPMDSITTAARSAPVSWLRICNGFRRS